MNLCVEGHVPKYKVTYKPGHAGENSPVCLVCESCMEKRRGFSSKDEIVLVETLDWKSKVYENQYSKWSSTYFQ